jgi:5-methylcytosine-specific restriction protein A
MAKEDWHHLYCTAAWRNARARQLAREPLCRLCRERSRIVAANVVDHIEPHKGDEKLFFDESNLQSLCAPCHDVVKKLQEQRGYLIGHDANGQPLDPSHPWNRSS